MPNTETMVQVDTTEATNTDEQQEERDEQRHREVMDSLTPPTPEELRHRHMVDAIRALPRSRQLRQRHVGYTMSGMSLRRRRGRYGEMQMQHIRQW